MWVSFWLADNSITSWFWSITGSYSPRAWRSCNKQQTTQFFFFSKIPQHRSTLYISPVLTKCFCPTPHKWFGRNFASIELNLRGTLQFHLQEPIQWPRQILPSLQLETFQTQRSQELPHAPKITVIKNLIQIRTQWNKKQMDILQEKSVTSKVMVSVSSSGVQNSQYRPATSRSMANWNSDHGSFSSGTSSLAEVTATKSYNSNLKNWTLPNLNQFLPRVVDLRHFFAWGRKWWNDFQILEINLCGISKLFLEVSFPCISATQNSKCRKNSLCAGIQMSKASGSRKY